MTACTRAETRKSQSIPPEEAERLEREVNLENWDDGGELSHFAFLSIPRIFKTAVIARGDSDVLPLETRLDENVARYEVALDGGGALAFDDYVASGALDGIVILRGGALVY